MSYQTAQIVGRKSLSDMITQNLSDPNMSITGSITGAVSSKLKAKATRFKERFDPMNIARVLGGGLGAAVYGRVAGRSDEDMRYFANKGKRGFKQTLDRQAKQNPLVTKISEGQIGRSQKGDGMATVLSRIYNLLKKNIESENKRHELDDDRAEERKEEKEKQHKEIIDALKGIGGTKVVTATKETKTQGGGLFDGLTKMIEEFKKTINELKAAIGPILDFVGEIIKSLTKFGIKSFIRLLGLLGNPMFLAIAVGVTTILALRELLFKLAEITPNYKAMSPAEAAAALTGSKRDIDALGGREYLEDIVKNGRKKAEDIDKMDEGPEKEKAIREIGGRDKLKQILEDKTEYAIPKNIDTGPDTVPPRPDTSGGKNKARAMKWDQQFGKEYNIDGTKKQSATPLPADVTPSTAGAGRGSTSDPRRIDTPSATPAAPAPNPVTQQLQQAVATNEEAKLDEATTPKVISIDASKTQTVPMSGGQPPITKDSSVSVRTDDGTLHKVLKQNLRPV